MTASNPETAAGEIALAGSQAICPSPVARPRANRTTAHPLVLKDGRSAAPIGPETPLTRTLEFMICRVSLYQFAESATKPQMHLKSAKPLKCQKACGIFHTQLFVPSDG